MTKNGRPTKYKEEYAEQAYKLCLLGATDKEIADFFQVDEETINNWKKRHKDFFGSLKKGKMIADADVADRLYQRAIGYSHPEDKIFIHEGKEIIVPTTKHYPPDPTSMIFWLKNRQRTRWRDRHELGGVLNIKKQLDNLSNEDLSKITEALQLHISNNSKQ